MATLIWQDAEAVAAITGQLAGALSGRTLNPSELALTASVERADRQGGWLAKAQTRKSQCRRFLNRRGGNTLPFSPLLESVLNEINDICLSKLLGAPAESKERGTARSAVAGGSDDEGTYKKTI